MLYIINIGRVSTFLLKLVAALSVFLISICAISSDASSNDDPANVLFRNAMCSSLISSGMSSVDSDMYASRYAFFCSMMTKDPFLGKNESRESMIETAEAMGRMLFAADTYYGSAAIPETASLMLLVVRAGASPTALSEAFWKIASSGVELEAARNAICAAAEAVRAIRPTDEARELLSVAADMAVARSSNDDIASRMAYEVASYLEIRRAAAKRSVRDDDQNGGDHVTAQTDDSYVNGYQDDSTASAASASSASDTVDDAKAEDSKSEEQSEAAQAQEPAEIAEDPAADAQADPQADKKE